MAFIGQLDFYVHLKEHYEGQSSILRPTKRKRHVQHEELDIHQEDDDPNSVPENLIIESLEDSQDDIKSEDIQDDDAFGFSEPEDMEDFRKEVEKVVETIGDTECLPDASWSYQVTDVMEDSSTNVGMIANFPEKIDHSNLDPSTFSNTQELKCDDSYSLCAAQNVKEEEEHILLHDFTNNSHLISNNHTGIQNELGTDEEDSKTLEQMRILLKKTKKYPKPKVQNDEEVEFNECLKKIQNFKCNDCNKCFNSRTALGYHLKTHSSERRYVCDQVCLLFKFLTEILFFKTL